MSISAHSSQTTMAIVPAQLGFLTIFNPSLGATDETIDEQIVYYASVNAQSKKRRYKSHGKPTVDLSQEERNERLRQIGLAQGMVEFSRGFANGEPVDTIETEKTRVVLQEIEPGWWILAVRVVDAYLYDEYTDVCLFVHYTVYRPVPNPPSSENRIASFWQDG